MSTQAAHSTDTLRPMRGHSSVFLMESHLYEQIPAENIEMTSESFCACVRELTCTEEKTDSK